MTKPRLPYEIEQRLPACLLRYMYTFVPKHVAPKPPSPGLQRSIESLQKNHSPKLTAMCLIDLEDFMNE